MRLNKPLNHQQDVEYQKKNRNYTAMSLRVCSGVKKDTLYDRTNRVDLLELTNPVKKP